MLTIKSLFLWLCISLAIMSCGDKDADKKTAEPVAIPTLNEKNSDAFTLNFGHDYYTQLEALVKALNKYQQANDQFGFVHYRNNIWTPKYIKSKNFYQAVLQKNQSYLSKTTIKPLFDRFENLIYIGINLKHAFLDDNQDLMDKTFAEIDHDKKIVATVLESAK